jgi:TAG lipase/lysophosphatidylethanolamine acyltransferase
MQAKMTFIHDTRQAFGRTSLILQGGSIFGMCHLGVVKALFLRGLLPQVITGTAVGALIAALVAVHTDEELPSVLSGDAINLSAFSASSGKTTPSTSASSSPGGHSLLSSPFSSSSTRRWLTLLRRLRRFTEKGYFLDVDVLERCVRDNVGELTFQEAFRRTGRVLNITVATAEQGGVPTVLNHITSPHVVRIHPGS